jgi:hypothetical protein
MVVGRIMRSSIECSSWMKEIMRICALHLETSTFAEAPADKQEDVLDLSAVVPAGTKADARGPTALTELSSIITLSSLSWRRSELSAFTPWPTGVSSVVPCD